MMSESDEEIAARRIGTSIGSWTIERVLGIGGVASVFLGRRADGYAAAVKVLHPYLRADPDIPRLARSHRPALRRQWTMLEGRG